MRAVVLEPYGSFRCLAGACPSTCCAGWKVFAGRRDYQAFLELDRADLRDDILSGLRREGEGYVFKRRADGSCVMLDGDGLCRIQKNSSERLLCNTCRKYPRLFYRTDESLYVSMAASCPVVSSYLVRGTVRWLPWENGAAGEGGALCARELKPAAGAWETYQENSRLAGALYQERTNVWLLEGCFPAFADRVLDLVLTYRDRQLPAEDFSFPAEGSGALERFLEESKTPWRRLRDNYMEYRIVGRRLERPEEEEAVSVRQAQGELFLLRMLAFGRYCRGSGLSDTVFCDLLQRVYRFCVHGKRTAEAFAGLLADFLEQDLLWSYLLL